MQNAAQKFHDKNVGGRWKRIGLWKVLAVGAVFITSGGVLAAQTAKQMIPRHQISMMMERAQKELNLSETQKAKITAILQDAAPRGINIHDNMKLAPEVKRAQLKTLKNSTQNKVEALLTSAQRQKVASWRNKAPQMMHARLEKAADELDLSPQQRRQIQPILARSFANGKSVRDDMTLTLAQKFSRLRTLGENTKTQVKAHLTPQQSTRLDSMLNQMRFRARQQFANWRSNSN